MKAARILHVWEALEMKEALHGTSVRITATVKKVSSDRSSVMVEQREQSGGGAMLVNIEHVSVSSLREGELFQFIGDVQWDMIESKPILHARVARNVAGLDEGLYKKALALRRQFEKSGFSFEKMKKMKAGEQV